MAVSLLYAFKYVCTV